MYNHSTRRSPAPIAVKREREETPEPSRCNSVSPTKKIKSEEYRLTSGPFKGCTIDELDEHSLIEIADDDELVKKDYKLHKALKKWAAGYRIEHGPNDYYLGSCLKDAPLAWIDIWLVPGAMRLSCYHGRLRIALKYHLPTRKPEVPGPKFVFTFGKNKSRSLDNLIEKWSNPLQYDEWVKAVGMPCREGYEDLADALVLHQQRKLDEHLRKHPMAPYFKFPMRGNLYRGKFITDLLLGQVFELDDDIGSYKIVDHDLSLAVRWRILKHHLVRWNWRGTFEEVNGERVFVPQDLGEFTYPSTKILERT